MRLKYNKTPHQHKHMTKEDLQIIKALHQGYHLNGGEIKRASEPIRLININLNALHKNTAETL